METINVVLMGSMSGELDRVPVTVRDPENCAREVLAAMTRAHWVLSAGDRIEIQSNAAPG